MKDITFHHWPSRKKACFVNSLSGYRMAFLIGTGASSPEANLAIFNSVVHLGSHPPLLGLVFRPLTVERHTYDRMKATGYLTINSVPLEAYRQAHGTSARYPEGVSEFEKCGFRPVYREGFPAPAVRESRLRMGCAYLSEHPIDENHCIFVIVRIQWVETREEAIAEDGFLDHSGLGNTGVIGLDAYYSARLLERLAYAEPDQPVTPLGHGA